MAAIGTGWVDGAWIVDAWVVGAWEGDITAPVLSLPTGTATAQTTATGTVSTDEGNGTLYFWATTNASESAANIISNGDSQSVSGTGVQNVSFTGLTAGTDYFAHYVQDDQADNESNVVSSTPAFTTDVATRGQGGMLSAKHMRRRMRRRGRR